MEESVKRENVWTSRLASPLIFWPAAMAGIALIALAVLGPEAGRRLVLEAQVADMQAEVDALQFTCDQLQATEAALQTDPAFLESTVRHELGVVRPGEVRLPQPASLRTSGPRQQATDQQPPDRRLVFLARFGDAASNQALLACGGALLLVAMVLSLPGRKPSTSQ